MVPVTVARLGLDSSSNSFVVVLQEQDGDRFLPIWIGRTEAESIAAHIQGVRRERPMTHDLLRGVLRTLSVRLVQVVVSHVESSTFFAELHLEQGGVMFVEDSRPSDAIALAVRCDAPVFVADELLLEPTDDEPDMDDDQLPSFLESSDASLFTTSATETPAEALQRYLASLRPEDFGKFCP
jgi:bifunctional DNase/RNase